MGADPGSDCASPARQTTCAPSQPVFWGRHRAAPQQGRSSRPPQGTCHGRCDVGQQPLCTVPEHSQGQNHHPATGAGLWQGPQSHPTPCCLWGARTLQALGRALQARGHRDGPRAFLGGLPQHRARGHRASPDAGVNAPGCVPRAPPGFPAGAEGATPPACPRSTPGWAAPGATRLPRGYHGATTGSHRRPPGGAVPPAGAGPGSVPPRTGCRPGSARAPRPVLGAAGAPGASPSRPCPSCRCTGTRPVPAPFPPRVPVPPLPACAAGSVSVPAPCPCPGPCPVPVPCPVPPPPPRVSGRRAPRSVTSRHGPAGAVTSRGGCPRPAPPDAARGPGTRGDPPGARCGDPAPRPAHAWDVPGGGRRDPQSLDP